MVIRGVVFLDIEGDVVKHSLFAQNLFPSCHIYMGCFVQCDSGFQTVWRGGLNLGLICREDPKDEVLGVTHSPVLIHTALRSIPYVHMAVMGCDCATFAPILYHRVYDLFGY
jgi:hypothetical protein